MKHINIKILTIFMCGFSCASAQIVTTLAGDTTRGSLNGTGSAARFYNPAAVVADGSGNLYVADGDNNEIRKIVISTGTVTTLAGDTLPGSVDGTGSSARFFIPRGLTYDGSGNLYVVDQHNNEIRKVVISTGAVTTLAGSTLAGSADGIGSAARFKLPVGIVYDGSDNLYVGDGGNYEVRKIVISTGAVTTLAGNTIAGSADGVGSAASFKFMGGIAYDGSGNLFVADGSNNEIRKIVISTGMVTTFAGTTIAGSVDGVGSAARFYIPFGVTYDGIGNLYIADEGNNEIRKIVISTDIVTTVAGTTVSGSQDGISSAASFNNPSGIAVDGSANLYLADSYNNEIRAVALSSLGIDQYSITNTQLNIYPNPTTGIFNISISALTKNTSIEIYNSIGALVYNKQTPNSETTIELTNQPNGLYFVKLMSDNKIIGTQKIIKQ